jgi:MFS transporter, DHA1 family, tetracycline resistance protein
VGRDPERPRSDGSRAMQTRRFRVQVPSSIMPLLASETRRVKLFPILLVNFIGTLGFSIVLPFLVTLVSRLGGNALVYGSLGACYSAFQLVGAPVLGRWSDQIGRRRILLLSQLGTLASWVIFLAALFVPPRKLGSIDVSLTGYVVVTLPLLLLYLARALDGVTGGNVSVANAYLADVTDEGNRKESFGRMAVAGNLGFILGPALAGLLGASRYKEALPVLAALGISLAACLVIAFYLPESRPRRLDEPPDQGAVRKVFGQEQRDCYRLNKERALSFRDVLGLPGIPSFLSLYFLIFLAFNLFYTSFPIHAAQGLLWSITRIGLFFSFIGLTTVAVQGPLLERLSRKFSDRSLMLVGGAILGVGFCAFTRASLPLLYVGASLFSLGNGLMWPSFLSLLSKAAGDRYQGAVQGLGGSVSSLASIIGLLLGGILYQAGGARVFFGSASLIFLVFGLTLVLFRKGK